MAEESVQGFGGKARKRTLGRSRCRWEDDIRMDLGRLAGGVGVEWIQLAQVRGWWQALVYTVMPLWVLAPCSYLVSYAHKYIIKRIGGGVVYPHFMR
jgi:hypothetical protein